MYKRLKCKAQIYKTPRRKHTGKFIDIDFGCNFFDMTSNAQITKAKSEKKKKQDYIRLKSFCTAKETNNKMVTYRMRENTRSSHK